MVVRVSRRRRRPVFKKPNWHVSFKNPFGFPMDQPLQMHIKNRRVVASCEKSHRRWLPMVRYANGKMLCRGTKHYIARSSAVTAAELFIAYVRSRRPREAVEEVQLALPLVMERFSLQRVA